ncbi:MAG: hypothetical protein IPL39_06825 [Opitutaceae bacterium]|nr:hypothetical protein [Opitutaceae bacterium]
MSLTQPAQRLQRVLLLARLDALSLGLVAAPAALVALATGDRMGAAVGAGVTLCGVAEWQGRARLLRRQISGIAWLCCAQLLCLLLILTYAWNLAQLVDPAHLLALLPGFTRQQLAELFPDPDALAALMLGMQRAVAGALALVSLLYQGAMAFYYLRSAPLARNLFAEPPVLAPGPLPPH